MLKDVAFKADAYEAAAGADVLVIITEWDQFRALDLNRLKATMKAPVLVDLRNIYNGEDPRMNGFKYLCIGSRARMA